MNFKTIKGSEIFNEEYFPIFPFFKDQKNAFMILDANFVSNEDGTGIVHIAPAFGEEDLEVCKKNKIDPVIPVNETGSFCNLKEFKDLHQNLNLNGKNVFEAESDIISYLKSNNILVSNREYRHNYPFCWRTDTPLMYKLVDSWYLEVTKIKDRMVELNQNVNWIPGHIKDGMFGNWIKNTRDWSISRNRFWGCPIPVWVSDNPDYPNTEVFGSIQEISDYFGQYYEKQNGEKLVIEDLHKHSLDLLKAPNPKDPTGKSMMVRVPEVLDCWFESGAMPYSQVHYPFEFRDRDGNIIRDAEENKKWFDEHFPADFVCEYLAQTRGWFYTMFVLAVAMFDKVPFKNCICHGVMLDEKGNKLSKKLKNYPDLLYILNKHGADALRFAMLRSSVVHGNEFYIDVKGNEVGKVLRYSMNNIWNAFSFLNIHLEASQLCKLNNKDEVLLIKDTSLNISNKMDRYILSKLSKLAEDVDCNMENYNSSASCLRIEKFLETLNNWYIRRSKSRFLDRISTKNKSIINFALKALKDGSSLDEFEKEYKCINKDKMSELFKKQNLSDNEIGSIACSLIKNKESHRLYFSKFDNENEMSIISESRYDVIRILYSVLYNFSKISSSLLPFLSEKIFLSLI